MTPREWLEVLAIVTCSITLVLIASGITVSPIEAADNLVRWFRDRKKVKVAEGRHRVVEDGRDVQDDPQVADHPGDDSTHEDGKEAAA